MAVESLDAFRSRLDGAAISTYVVVMIVVPLKLWCRKRSGGWRNLGLDDLISVIALLLANAFIYVCLIGMRPYLGKQITELQNPTVEVVDFLKFIFWGQILYVWAIPVIKFSILAFYWRLFSVAARVPILVVAFIVLAWLIALNFLVIFTCTPIRASWDITIVGAKCLNLKSIYIGGSIPNVITDAILIIMPIPYVWRLNSPLTQRIVLAGMFMLGIFIAIVSMIRLAVFLNIPIATSANVTYNFRDIIIWSVVEINIGLACACLPSLKPVVSFLGLNRFFTTFSNSRPSNGTPNPSGPNSDVPSFRKSDNSGKHHGRKKGATGGLFSTLAGLTKIDSEEDGFQMVDHQDDKQGKNISNIEMGRISHESDNSGSKNSARNGGINVQKDWSVLVDDRRRAA
ncbi:hypothetical protein EJ04DRAFT_565153 [Polyplosphaeria fusca]|uniref:Rhodopsin domain-containing protein n=1 Tax=Polyplosphaeria fusca TaxID=682080 RepID=A0A9P4QVA0_9PLEO|nr:hypothetical protein EJ04DRAFT_565153 [Polyplosphaeria fusca]